MRKAIALAERGRGRPVPNPMVGALVVDRRRRDRRPRRAPGRGRAARGSDRARRTPGARAQGATLYCTLEPCSHTGRTGPCAPLVDGGRDRARGHRASRIPIRSSTAAAWRTCASAASRSSSASSASARGAAERGVPHQHARCGRPHVIIKAALSARRPARRGAGRPHRADRAGGQPARPPPARRSGRDRRRVGHDPGRRSRC